MKIVIAVAAMAFGLVACAPVIESANEVGGIIKVGSGLNRGAALNKADAHCRAYGKAARVSGQNPWDSTMTFDCVAVDAPLTASAAK